MIDTHQHLLYPESFNYPWTEDVPALQKAFQLEDYREAAEDLKIEGSLFMEVDVEASQAADEAAFFCRMAEDPESGVFGVIAAGRPEEDGFGAHIDAIAHDKLVGIRRVLHTQPDNLSESRRFRDNLRLLSKSGLTFDLCLLARQLPVGIELVDTCPEVSFVLDHCGVPDIAAESFDTWSESIGFLAERENVTCKISGLPTYCAPGKTGAEVLRPWVERVVECFGWDRVVWGGDWPVCTLNGSLREWIAALDVIFAEESEANLEKLYRANARRVYGL